MMAFYASSVITQLPILEGRHSIKSFRMFVLGQTKTIVATSPVFTEIESPVEGGPFTNRPPTIDLDQTKADSDAEKKS